MTLLIDLAFIPETHKPVTDKGQEETQTQSSQQETSLVTESPGTCSTIQYI